MGTIVDDHMDWYRFDEPGMGVRRMVLETPQPQEMEDVGIIVETTGDAETRLMIDSHKEGKWYTTHILLSPQEVERLVAFLIEISFEE